MSLSESDNNITQIKENIKKCEENIKIYEENIKKHQENIKLYEENMRQNKIKLMIINKQIQIVKEVFDWKNRGENGIKITIKLTKYLY